MTSCDASLLSWHSRHLSPARRTAAIDRLAREGILFADARVPIPLTLPSHATMLTGLYPASHGIRLNGIPLADETTTLAERLKEAGYETAAFIGNQVLAREFRLDRGFDLYDDRWYEGYDPSVSPEEMTRRGDIVRSSFVDWLDDRKKRKPFFAWVHLYDPHTPYKPPAPFEEAYDDAYAGEVAFIDRQIGAIVEALEEEGILDETILALVSDHGEGLGDHGEIEHGFLLFETTLAIPWILRLPGGPSGRIVREPVESLDLAPTLAGLVPVEPDPAWQGQSILPLLESAPPGGDRPCFAETRFGETSYRWSPLWSLRAGRRKLVRGSRDELYDLDTDPGETTDLAAERPETVAELAAALDRARADQQEPEGEPTVHELSREEQAKLEALGYVAPRFAPRNDTSRPHPTDYIESHQLMVRGDVHWREGRMEEARECYRAALDIDGENTLAMEGLGNYYRAKKVSDKEEEMLAAVVAIDPGNASVWNNLGNIHLSVRRDGQEAYRCYSSALTADSTYALAHVNIGNLWLMATKPDEALVSFRAAIRHDPNLAEAHYGKAIAHKNRGEWEEHGRELRAALESNPDLEPAETMLREYESRPR